MYLVLTDSELAEFLDDLDNAEHSIYKRGVRAGMAEDHENIKQGENTLHEDPLNEIISDKSYLKPYLDSSALHNGSIESVSKALKELRERVENLCKIQLTTSFVPNAVFIETLKDWVRNNLKKDTLIDMNYDPEVLGGAIVVYNGVYKDYSLSKSLDNYFKGFANVNQLPR